MIPLMKSNQEGKNENWGSVSALVTPDIHYKGVNEKIYKTDHPDVLTWTKKFTDRFQALKIFETFAKKNPGRSLTKAQVVGVHWHWFSDTVPWLLCQLTANLSNNRMRHYAIQPTFEELGEREESQIHADLFWQAAEMAGLTEQDRNRLRPDPGMTRAMNFLIRATKKCKTDSEVLGMMLGLEIPAKENIETIFSSLAHRTDLDPVLSGTKFFRFHRFVESEHIRLTVANFLRFCTTDQQKEEFCRGCDRGLKFWKMYWSSMSKLIAKEGGANAPQN